MMFQSYSNTSEYFVRVAIKSNRNLKTFENNMLFSHVKIPYLHTKALLVFYWCLYKIYQFTLISNE